MADDVIDLIHEQHREIRRLFDAVEAAQGPEREEAFRCLVRLLAVHETAEEELIHPEVRRNRAGTDVVDARLREEGDAKQMLSDLEGLGVDHHAFATELAAVRRAVEAHANAEEAEELPLLREVHDDDVRARMATELRALEAMAPTHPHPHGPESATGNLLVGPFVAVADRVRDALGQRRSG